MKKQVALALGLAVISGSALASKARLEALGENADGSQYIMDARNIFLNPAQANYFKDMVTIEAGDSSNADSTATPNAEGGFLRASGNMVYGLFLGHDEAVSNTVRTNAGGTTAELVDQNTWDLFVAGDAGVQWGANLSYMNYKNDQATGAEIESDAVRANFGIISGDTEVFLRTSIIDTAEEDGAVDLEIKSRYVLGASHNYDGGTIFFRYDSFEAEESETADTTWKNRDITLGYGKVNKLNDSASFNWKVAYANNESEDRNFSTANGDEEGYRVFAAMGIEATVKEWLMLRASIAQNILSESENDAGDATSAADSTKVAAGASLVWGDFQVDGMIGNDANGDGTASDDNGTIRTDSLLTRVSATYRF